MTLIELSLVMIISGIILSILIGMTPLLFSADKVKDTRTIINNADHALRGYMSVHRRLPCPDTDGDGQENREDNGTADNPTDDSCPSYEGNLPFVTLGLPSGRDVWKNRLRYGVYSDLTRTDTDSFCSNLVGFINASATTGSEEPGETDKLYVTARSDPLNPSVNMAYVIISGGLKDVDGSGNRFDGFNGSAPPHQFECEERLANGDYDDIVKTRTLSYLYGKHCIGNQW